MYPTTHGGTIPYEGEPGAGSEFPSFNRTGPPPVSSVPAHGVHGNRRANPLSPGRRGGSERMDPREKAEALLRLLAENPFLTETEARHELGIDTPDRESEGGESTNRRRPDGNKISHNRARRFAVA